MIGGHLERPSLLAPSSSRRRHRKRFSQSLAAIWRIAFRKLEVLCFHHSTGVLRIVGAEMAAQSGKTLKLIWVMPAERGDHVFRRTGLSLSDDGRFRRRHRR